MGNVPKFHVGICNASLTTFLALHDLKFEFLLYYLTW